MNFFKRCKEGVLLWFLHLRGKAIIAFLEAQMLDDGTKWIVHERTIDSLSEITLVLRKYGGREVREHRITIDREHLDIYEVSRLEISDKVVIQFQQLVLPHEVKRMSSYLRFAKVLVRQ